MAIIYKSHTLEFNPNMNRVELKIEVQNTDQDESATFSLHRTDDNSENYSATQQERKVGANSTQTFYYYDYTAEPSKLISYTASNIEREKAEDGSGIVFSLVYTADDLLLAHKDGSNLKTLNIKYNPDITSMKLVTGDAITQTLGSKYPYFRRNGEMKYKQFNIGGLISYHEDAAFWSAPVLTGYDLSETDIERIKEKQFREAVLEFLYDSKPKILKSTTEGCMIVKLTGISLTPNKQLGRSIYSFTAQATEYCDPSIENLINYGKAFESGEVTV